MKLRKIFWVVALIALVSIGASWQVRSYVEDTAHTTGHTGPMMLGVRNDTLAALAGTDGDYTPPQFDAIGNLYVTASSHPGKTLLFARVDVDLAGTQAQLIAGVSAKKIYVVEMLLTVSAQCELEFIEDTTPCVGAPPMYLPAYGGVSLRRDAGYRFATTTAAEGLDIDEVANGSVNVRGSIWYYVE